MSVNELRQALKGNLDAIPDTQVDAYINLNGTPPFIGILFGGIDYDQAMVRGHDDVTFTIQAVANGGDRGQQALLDRYVDNEEPYSVKLAAESDRTLGGLCQDLHVTDASGVQIVTRAQGGEVLVVEWTVLVLAPGVS